MILRAAIFAALLTGLAIGQEPSLGDVARSSKRIGETRKAKHVITDDDLPSKSDPSKSDPQPGTPALANDAKATNALDNSLAETRSRLQKDRLTPEEEKEVKERLVELKAIISKMEAEQKELSDGADQKAEILKNSRGSGLCNAQKLTSGPTTCEIIEADQARLQQIKRQLPQAQARLQEMQERLRSMGYGSAVYDP